MKTKKQSLPAACRQLEAAFLQVFSAMREQGKDVARVDVSVNDQLLFSVKAWDSAGNSLSVEAGESVGDAIHGILHALAGTQAPPF